MTARASAASITPSTVGPPGSDHADDATVLQQITPFTNSRSTYGYRRIWAMVNRQYGTGYNRASAASCVATG
jgi:hypothetical protein